MGAREHAGQGGSVTRRLFVVGRIVGGVLVLRFPR
jgi:hypothetical protein